MSAGASSQARGGRKPDVRASLDATSARRKRQARFFLLAAALVFFPALAQTLYLVPDSALHLAWARSLLWDRDVDFTNEYARYGAIESEGAIRFAAPTALGRPGNPFGLGSALFWMPWMALGAGAARLAGAASDGFGTTALQAAALGSWSAVLAALALVLGALRAVAARNGGGPARHLAPALVGAFLGTPLLYYVLQLPTYAHAVSVFTSALVLWLSIVWKDDWTGRRAFALGSAVGLAALVRTQDVVFGILPLVLFLGSSAGRRKPAPKLALFVLGTILAFSPQVFAWTRLYGSPLVLPQGEGFLRGSGKALGAVLFSARHGLFVWTPVTLLAVVGLVQLARTASTRALGIASLAALGAEWVLNALPVDWWAGWSFGARRFTSSVPLFALGLWVVCSWGRSARVAVAATTAASLVQWLRVAHRSLNAEADPGWGMLWGSGFFGFLPQVPKALFEVVRSSWLDIQVIRRPQSVPPDFHVDPAGLAYGLWILWVALVLGFAWRRWGRGSRIA